MNRLSEAGTEVLAKDGITSLQIISAKSGISDNVVITKVTVAPGGFQDRHQHATSEQIWIVLGGRGTLLLEGDREETAIAGEALRFAPRETHGVRNDAETDFVYLSVTSPPEGFDKYYVRQEN